MSDDFLSDTELERITGTRNAKQQADFFRQQGLNPWTHPRTGEVVIYRDVVKLNQAGRKLKNDEDGFTMDLSALGG